MARVQTKAEGETPPAKTPPASPPPPAAKPAPAKPARTPRDVRAARARSAQPKPQQTSSPTPDWVGDVAGSEQQQANTQRQARVAKPSYRQYEPPTPERLDPDEIGPAVPQMFPSITLPGPPAGYKPPPPEEFEFSAGEDISPETAEMLRRAGKHPPKKREEIGELPGWNIRLAEKGPYHAEDVLKEWPLFSRIFDVGRLTGQELRRLTAHLNYLYQSGEVPEKLQDTNWNWVKLPPPGGLSGYDRPRKKPKKTPPKGLSAWYAKKLSRPASVPSSQYGWGRFGKKFPNSFRVKAGETPPKPPEPEQPDEGPEQPTEPAPEPVYNPPDYQVSPPGSEQGSRVVGTQEPQQMLAKPPSYVSDEEHAERARKEDERRRQEVETARQNPRESYSPAKKIEKSRVLTGVKADPTNGLPVLLDWIEEFAPPDSLDRDRAAMIREGYRADEYENGSDERMAVIDDIYENFVNNERVGPLLQQPWNEMAETVDWTTPSRGAVPSTIPTPFLRIGIQLERFSQAIGQYGLESLDWVSGLYFPRLGPPTNEHAREVIDLLGRDYGKTMKYLNGWLGRISGLSLNHIGLGDRIAKTLAKSPNLANMQDLYLIGNGITDEGAEALVNAKSLTGLKELHLESNRVSEEGFKLLKEKMPQTRIFGGSYRWTEVQGTGVQT